MLIFLESLVVAQTQPKPEAPNGTINGHKLDAPENLFDQDGVATGMVTSVNMDDRYAVIKFPDLDVVCGF